MKTHKLITLALCFAASAGLAQTADQYVAAGRNSLVAHNLAGAYSNFNAAVTVSPAHETANALLAVTRLLVLPQQPAGSNFLNRLGFSASGRDLYNWTATLPQDVDGNLVLPANFNSSEVISYYRANVIPALAASRTNLARITNTNFTLSLTADETSTESVTLDYGDILLLQALGRGGEFLGYTLSAHNFSLVINHLMDLGNMEPSQLTIQRVLADYPSLLSQSSASDLAASKGAFTNASALYLAASDFIRNTRPGGVQRLFNLDTNDDKAMTDEAQFRDSLAKAMQSLDGPVQFSPSDPSSIYAGAYFAGTRSLRSLMPQFNGNQYVNNSLPDYTFGGVLLNEPACDTEALLRNFLNRPYAGIYTGNLSDSYYGGAFAAFLGTDRQAVIVGYDDDIGSSAFVRFSVHDGGDWYFETNGLSDSGPFIISGYGSFHMDGSFSGEFDYFTTNWFYLFSQYLDGNRSSPLGGGQGSAGYYSGSWTGGGQSGKLYAVLCADGRIYYSSVGSDGANGGGSSGQVDSSNHFTITDSTGTVVSGTLNPSTHSLSGTFASPNTSGSWSMTRSAFVPFDVPPVITSNLPPVKAASLGTNATFFLVVTGSPPMCFQWYFDGIAIPNATTNFLVVSNLQYGSAGTYTVAIDNLAGETNAAVELVVTAETIPPILSITNVTAGMNVSNAAFAVKGTAHDNVAVSNVFYSLNHEDWTLATSANNWSNWTAAVTLVQGTNTIAAFAVDTSGNVSATNTVNFFYVVSAALTVSTNGVGSLSPNYNGASLQIGKMYSITATAGTGFMFTNWMGGTDLPLSVITNGPTVQFQMQSNLMLQATFVDVTKPTLAITNVTAGMNVSNALFIVKGTASDNVGVGFVLYSVNNGEWTLANTANGLTNWNAIAALMPGTNTFAAYAVDATGNKSITNTLNFFYVVSAPLTVSTNGLGSLSPNYNGALLQIGKSYAITATAGTGFAFTNWMGGTNLPLTLLTNGSTVQFVMVTNLMLQATFVDVTKPTLAITNVTAGMNVSNATFTVRGTAGDNMAVSNVLYSLNNAGWSNAVTGNNWSNWMAAVTLLQGTNTIAAYAVDATGNKSITNTLNFFYVVSAPLTVSTNGLGSLSPNYNGALLQIGKSYAITATAGTGFAFTNWMGGTNLPLTLLTNGSTVQFMMASNLTLQATFVDISKPTLAITNLTAGQRVTNAAFTVKGTASDNWQVSNVVCQINGGGWLPATNLNLWTNWAAGVTLVPGTNTVQVYAVDTTGNTSATNSLNFQYVVTNLLGLQKVGLGTLSPTNQLLELGRNYSIAATPASGFLFTNWMKSTNWLGGVQTNNATVQFQMASNLTLQATFVDVTKPTLTISAPTAGQHMTNALATVVGTTADNWKVSGVWYQVTNGILTSGTWTLVTTTNNYTNWTTTITLAAGTNTLKAYAVDLGGNYSTTGSVSVISSNTFQLQLRFAVPQPLTSTGLNFGLQLSPGLNGRIQTSTNLADWTTLTNFVGTNSTLNFRDPAATNLNRRFYRAVVP